MIKKKILGLSLAIIMSVSITACGSETSGNQVSQSSTESTMTEESLEQIAGDSVEDSETETSDEKDSVVKPADVNVSDISELSREEKTAWMAYLFDALQNLDGETVSLYFDTDITELMNAVKADSEDLAFYNTIIGSMYYLPEYDIVIGKDPYYMLAMAYKEVYRDTSLVELVVTNEENDEKWGLWIDVTRDFANGIIDRYWEEAPYIVLNYNASDALYVKDGKLMCTFQYAALNYSPDSYVGYNAMYPHAIFNTAFSNIDGLNYGAMLFGSVYGNKYTSDIPKGSYPQFFSRAELFTAENFYDIEAFLEVAQQMDEYYTSSNCFLYTDYLNNAPDDTNYNAFVESFNNGTYKMAVMDEMIMYYCPGSVNTTSTTYYYADDLKTEKIPLDEEFYSFCEEEGIVIYEKLGYTKIDGISCVTFPINFIVYNMEQEGILTRYEDQI